MFENFSQNIWYLVGPLAGFTTFLAGTASMDGIYRRPNSDNTKVFSLEGLWEYIKAPFQVGTPQFYTVWGILPGIKWSARLKMIQLNWVAMIGAGSLLAYLMFLLI